MEWTHPLYTPRHNSRYISSELSRLTVKCLS
jgi:hypothetical protein